MCQYQTTAEEAAQAFDRLQAILWRFFALIVVKMHFAATRFIFTFQVVDIYLFSEHTPAQTFQLRGVTTSVHEYVRPVLQHPFGESSGSLILSHARSPLPFSGAVSAGRDCLPDPCLLVLPAKACSERQRTPGVVFRLFPGPGRMALP